MRLARPAVFVLAIILSSSLARADKVAVVDMDRLYVKGGITRWLAARAKLDEDHGKFRVVESPDGKSQPTRRSCDATMMGAAYCKRMEKLDAELRDSQEWEKLERAVLDPIEAEVTRALEAYAKAQRIDVLFQREAMMLYISPSADITAAFIKSFNAAPPPKPKR